MRFESARCERDRPRQRSTVTWLAAFLLLTVHEARAGKILDYIRAYDLNDYALGLAITGSQSEYLQADSSTYAYPYLTSFHDSAFTDSWLLIRDGDLGIRWVSGNAWEIGVVGRVQTTGTETSDDAALAGIRDRDWALEMGPVVSWRGWPIHINLNAYSEITGDHHGLTGRLTFSWPRQWDRGYVVPSVEVIYRDAKYTDYYYGVTADESTPVRPVYAPGRSTSNALRVRWGYRLSGHWLLSGGVGVEFLDDVIANSPIVGKDDIWSARVGLAYNADLFQPRGPQRTTGLQPRFEFRLAMFDSSINSQVIREPGGGVPGLKVDLEDALGMPDHNTILQLGAQWRIGHYHRIEAGYFKMSRSGARALANDITFGNETFAAATEVTSQFEMKLASVMYGYSLINDDQKELSVAAGLHYPVFETVINAPDTGQMESQHTETPLPVIGAAFAVELGYQLTVSARAQLFRMNFDRYEGSLNYLAVDLLRNFGDRFRLGLGYSYYGFSLRSHENDGAGGLKIDQHGPLIFASMGF